MTYKERIEKIRDRLDEIRKRKYANCFQAHRKGKNDYCFGIIGGTASTDYLDEGCIDCPYLKIPIIS